MKQLFLAGCGLILAVSAQAQYLMDLGKEDPLQVPVGLHIDSVVVAFADSGSIGNVLRGLGNTPRPTFLQGGNRKALTAILHNGPDTARDHHCTMRVNTLEISEVSNGTGERCFYGLNFELLTQTDSGWVRIFDHAASGEYPGGLDATGKQPRNILKAFEEGLAQYAEAAKNNKLVSEAVTQAPRAGEDGTTDQAYPALAIVAPARGLYRTFKEFRDQRPDTVSDFSTQETVLGDARQPIIKLKVDSGDVRAQEVWGLSDGRYAYMNIGGRKFLRLVREDGRFIANYRTPGSVDGGTAIGVGVAFGLVGVLIYAAANSKGESIPAELDMRTGVLKPSKTTMAGNGIIENTSDHIFIYSRHCPADTLLGMYVYGGIEASLRKENYHRLNLVPRPGTVPVEFKVGEGKPVSLDISTDNVVGDPEVYLVKVGKDGTPTIDQLHGDMARDVLSKLKPSNEVK